MPMAPPTYCFDTSSLIHAWRRAYPPKSFGRLWRAFDDLIEAGRMVASIEVLAELEKKDDDVCAWAKERKEAMFRDIEEDEQDALVTIMSRYPRLVDTAKGKSGGDPFVIAKAMCARPTLTVVHEEHGGSEQSPKIPFVCEREGIRHINLLTLIDEEGWEF